MCDVFLAAARDPLTTAELAPILGQCWDLGAQQVSANILEASPQVAWASQALHVGRCVLRARAEAASPAPAPSDTAAGALGVSAGSSGASGGDGLADHGGVQNCVAPPQQTYALTRHACRLLERVAACVLHREPVLLVGETGSGKTSSVQELASLTRRKLLVQNLSLSTDSTDLLGGFRPVTVRQMLQPSYESFVRLFQDTFSSQANGQYLDVCLAAFNAQQWRKMLKAFSKAAANAAAKLRKTDTAVDVESAAPGRGEGESGGERAVRADLARRWAAFRLRTERLALALPRVQAGFAFAFVDGLLVQAMQQGHWVLLDEVPTMYNIYYIEIDNIFIYTYI